MTVLAWSAVGVVVLLACAWYLSYSAARLDRLHAKVEGAVSALDAHLVRRAEAALELANSGALDPATALLLASAASESLERVTEHAVDSDPLDGQHFGGREGVETGLTETIHVALPTDTVVEIAAVGGRGAAAVDRVRAAGLRVQLARRFHNDAVEDVRRVRAKPVVRLFRLAGHAHLPEPVVFRDDLPPG